MVRFELFERNSCEAVSFSRECESVPALDHMLSYRGQQYRVVEVRWSLTDTGKVAPRVRGRS